MDLIPRTSAGAVPTPTRRRRRWLAPAVVAVPAAALVASLWHIVALESYVSAGRPYDPTAGRLSSAQLALTLEPWSARFAWRAIALRALDTLEKGNADGAYWLMDPYLTIVHGTDAAFVAIYKQILAIKTPIDSGKAHVAHGLDPYNNFSTGASGTPTPSAPVSSTTP
jgi:hypothetical protein